LLKHSLQTQNAVHLLHLTGAFLLVDLIAKHPPSEPRRKYSDSVHNFTYTGL
jgi:hypothetical protein